MNIAELIESTKAALVEYQAAADRLQGVIFGQGFIVRCDGLCLAFDIDADRRVSKPKSAAAYRATRFTRADAARVAATVKNGHGTVGEAIHVRDAIAQEIDEQSRLLKTLQAHQAKTEGQAVEVAAEA